MDLEASLDRLFQCQISEFVRERNALSAELKRSGDVAGAAARVKALARPTAAAWAVNQLAFVATKHLQALFAAAAGLREAHEHGGAATIQEAGQRYRRALDQLTQQARTRLEQSGHSADVHSLRKVTATLSALAAGLDDDQIRAGRLSRDIEAQGFTAISGIELGKALSPTHETSAAHTLLDELTDQVRKLERDAHLAKARAATADGEARDAELRAEHARLRAEAARNAALEAMANLDSAQHRLLKARSRSKG